MKSTFKSDEPTPDKESIAVLGQPPVVQAHRSHIHLVVGCLAFSLTGGSLVAAFSIWDWLESFEAAGFMAMLMALAGLCIGIVYVQRILHDLRLMQLGRMDPEGLRGTRIAYVLVWLAVWSVPILLLLLTLVGTAIVCLAFYSCQRPQ